MSSSRRSKTCLVDNIKRDSSIRIESAMATQLHEMLKRRSLFSTVFSAAVVFTMLVSVAQLSAQASIDTATTQKRPDRNDIYKIGGEVSPPVLVHSVKPRFPKEARNLSLKANVLINLYVERNGKPGNVHSVRTTYVDSSGRTITPYPVSITNALEESAIEAVKQYRFKPAMKGTQPVPVELNIQVPFSIF